MSDAPNGRPSSLKLMLGELSFVIMGLVAILLAVVLAGAVADRYFTGKLMDRNIELDKQEAFAKGMTYEDWRRLQDETAAANERARAAEAAPSVQAAAAEARDAEAQPVQEAAAPANETALSAPDLNYTQEEVQAMMKKAVVVHTTMGSFVIEIRPDDTPRTVKNFLYLVQNGFYDGMPFYRVNPGISIMTGSPTGRLGGTAGYAVGMESGTLPAKVARVAFLPAAGDETAVSSEFCIYMANSSEFTGVFPVFGRVIHNWDVVEKVASSYWDREGYLDDRAFITRMEIMDWDKVPPEMMTPAPF